MEAVQYTSLSIPSLFGRLLRRVNPWKEGKCKNGTSGENFVGIWRPDSRRSEADLSQAPRPMEQRSLVHNGSDSKIDAYH